MHRKVFVALAAILVLGGLAAGCGGDDQGDNQAQKTQAQGQGDQRTKQGGRTVGGEGKARKAESVEGVVAKADNEKEMIWVRPEGGEVTRFIVRPEKAKVTLDGEEAKPEAIERGQRAKVTYVVVEAKERDVKYNVARAVTLNPQEGEERDTA